MVEYAPEPLRDTDLFGNPIDDPDWEPWMEPPSGWSEWEWKGPNRRLVVNGTPPPPALVSDIITKPDITGVMINRLGPEFRDLHWLEPEALVASTMREFEVGSVGGVCDVRSLRWCRSLETVALSPRAQRQVDFSDWSSTLTALAITQGSPVRFQHIQRLELLNSLSVDLPGRDVSYVGNLPVLEEVSFTAARSLTALPFRTGQPIKRLLVHQSPSLDLSFLSEIDSTLLELQLDGVKRLENSEALASCKRLRRIVLENCGPNVAVDDLLRLMSEGALSEVVIIGSLLPFPKEDGLRLASQAPPRVKVAIPPIADARVSRR